MKKSVKIILIILGVLVGAILLDTVQALVFNNSPILKIREYLTDSDVEYKDKGLLVDTYYSASGEKDTVIKGGSHSFAKPSDFEIVDTSLEMDDFMCLQALEEIFRDDKYTYYLNCIKSSYIIVTYSDGTKENVKDALASGHITIDDLDRFNIGYGKEEK